MSGMKMIYQIERAAALQEYRGSGRPDVIVLPNETYREIIEKTMLVFAHKMEKDGCVYAEERLCGMRVETSPYLKNGKFILGTEYSLDLDDDGKDGTI